MIVRRFNALDKYIYENACGKQMIKIWCFVIDSVYRVLCHYQWPQCLVHIVQQAPSIIYRIMHETSKLSVQVSTVWKKGGFSKRYWGIGTTQLSILKPTTNYLVVFSYRYGTVLVRRYSISFAQMMRNGLLKRKRPSSFFQSVPK